MPDPRHLVRPEDALERVAAAAARDESAVDACRRLVLAIRRADTQRGTDLEKTLRTYYACGATVQATADALFLHRNSVRYRLDSVRILVGFDLDHPVVASALMAAFAVDEAAAAREELEKARHEAQRTK
ncbi:MAG: helix-turn-helix domain-containing protein [Candidatus Eremiobacteraeota bacterium]|nr:helix-turn-helix domain-containing protein [Candidatus Eremiobacteraeota bacterium]